MLPRIEPESTLAKNYQSFLKELRKTTYSGEIDTRYSARLAVAIDNSIYQVIPQAVIFPRSTQDISLILTLASQEKFRSVKFCPRGGGTSTNGQSLSAGIIIDCSKYMCEIIELNLDQGWVRAQPGVVLDQLNTYLKTFGVCFAPEISPSNRATIGGMVNTDACGMGSLLLGRTSDHVLDLIAVLSDGSIIHTTEINAENPLGQNIIKIIQPNKNLINEKFTSAPRTLNGYNLKKTYNDKLNLNYLFCGSEGTLGVISECKLKLTTIPKFSKLILLKYRDFDDALRDHQITENFKPLAIEAIDEKLIDLARSDILYFQIKNFVENINGQTTGAVNLVEFVADNANELEETVKHFCNTLSKSVLGHYVAKNKTEEKCLWELRKKSVGILSKKQDGTRRPIPFVEDTAVPPEKLADYIGEFKTLLDEYNLMYGMFGHVDAGCVHVRPALDMKLIEDEKRIPEITQKVVALLEKYGGVLWGEHGQGHRCEYAEKFFGEKLYYTIRQIKTLFDPNNQLNPGKIATPIDSQDKLVTLTGPMRGQFDRQIRLEWQDEFSTSIACNGNGACFNYATDSPMCPSYKVTKERIHSPKGRATLMREWLRQLSLEKVLLNINNKTNIFYRIKNSLNKKTDFSHEVFSAMSGCLACKACAGQCPLSVDVPEFKAKFLAYYYQRYFRPFRDYFIASLESIAPTQAKFAKLNNWILQNKWIRFLLRKVFKLVDPPSIAMTSADQELTEMCIPIFNLILMQSLSDEEKKRCVILLQDAFTSYYEPTVLVSTYQLLVNLGFAVYVAPFFPSGKPLHVKGFLKKFSRVANKNHQYLNELVQLNIPLIGIDPSITLTYRDEYKKLFGKVNYNIQLLQEWLVNVVYEQKYKKSKNKYFLLSHCTEKTACAESEKQWQTIFAAFGLELESLPVGCCGMAGSYGHEAEHFNQSKALFNMDWQRFIEKHPENIVATGYSCRSQSDRLMNIKLRHPIEVLDKNSAQ